MHVTSFLSKFHGHMFISLKVISALQKKEKEGTRKKVNKKKNKVITQLLEACISLSISNVALVSYFMQFSFQNSFMFHFYSKAYYKVRFPYCLITKYSQSHNDVNFN